MDTELLSLYLLGVIASFSCFSLIVTLKRWWRLRKFIFLRISSRLSSHSHINPRSVDRHNSSGSGARSFFFDILLAALAMTVIASSKGLMRMQSVENSEFFNLIYGFLYEMGLGLCRVSYENELSLVYENIDCAPSAHVNNGFFLTLVIFLIVYLMIRFKKFVIIHDF